MKGDLALEYHTSTVLGLGFVQLLGRPGSGVPLGPIGFRV